MVDRVDGVVTLVESTPTGGADRCYERRADQDVCLRREALSVLTSYLGTRSRTGKRTMEHVRTPDRAFVRAAGLIGPPPALASASGPDDEVKENTHDTASMAREGVADWQTKRELG